MTTKLNESDISQPAPMVLTAKQVAQQLQLGISTVYLYAQTGVLPSKKIGKSLRFPAEGIANLFSKQGGRA